MPLRWVAIVIVTSCTACVPTEFDYLSANASTDSGVRDVGAKVDANAGCGPNLTGIVRDFKDDHPDFEKYPSGVGEKGLVGNALGGDAKPVFVKAGAAQVTSTATFDQWYRSVPGVNMPFQFTLEMTKGAGGISTFDDPMFFGSPSGLVGARRRVSGLQLEA